MAETLKPSPLSATLYRMAGRPYHDDLSDRELIERFRSTGDQSAFATLVDRHGRMVLGACRRSLRDFHAADDAFQATFLVLAQKAGIVSWKESLGGWLYQVTQHVCRKARARISRRAVVALPGDVPAANTDANPASEFSAIIDEELRALPAAYREAVVLCHLEGQTVDEAAKNLGISVGQIRGRLHRGRDKLRDRLGRRGVVLSAATLTLAVGQASATTLPTSLVASVVRDASALAAGELASTSALSLTHEVLHAMSRTKLHLIAISMMAIGGILTAGLAMRSATAEQANTTAIAAVKSTTPIPRASKTTTAKKPIAAKRKIDDDKPKVEDMIDRREGKIGEIDAAKNEITLILDEDAGKITFEVGATTKLQVARQAVKVSELKAGMHIVVQFKGEAKAPFEVVASWPRVDAVLKAIDATKRTLSMQLDADKGVDIDVSLVLLADAEVKFDGLPAGLADVPTGKKLSLEMSVDRKTVAGIRIEGEAGDVPAHLKSIDAKSKTVTLVLSANNDKAERKVELAFGLAEAPKFRLAGKDVTMAELQPDMPVVVRMALDRRTITHLWAGPVEPKEKDDDDDK